MIVIHGINKIRKYKRPMVAIGVFDGVHRAHIQILRASVEHARRINGTSIVLTFYPHPQLEDDIYSLNHRLRLIAGLGVDVCVVINLSKALYKMPAEDFIRNILVKKIRAEYIYVGKNFTFGRGAEGNYKLLKSLSKVYGFKLKVFRPIKINSKIISSTYIRKLISEGRLDTAERLLSRAVSILGTVTRGSSLGRKLGFPTANINPHHDIIPPSGIYAVKITLSGKRLKGVCYIGTRPTFSREIKKYVEVHIFNFNKNIYNKELEVQFVKKIRADRKFKLIKSLVKQIKKDVQFARNILSSH